MIKFEYVLKVYGEKEVFSDLIFFVKDGEIFGLIGYNGVGKIMIISILIFIIDVIYG